MSELNLESLVSILGRSAPDVGVLDATTGEKQLSELGITSLLLLNIIIEVATEHDLDLTHLAEEPVQPQTVNDLLVLLKSVPLQ